MKISLDALQVLDTIDRRGSFAAAADELFRVPSAITYTVQKLEQDLDVRLFERKGSRAHLTPAGRALLEEGRHLLLAARQLEDRVRKVATGWETALNIAVCDLIPIENLFPLLAEFYATDPGTRIRLSREVYGGCWDALQSGRADLVVGAPGEGPPGGTCAVRPLAEVTFVFAVAPNHPLARSDTPIRQEDLLQYRVVSATDSSRHLPPRSAGILAGQEILGVPDMQAKIAAQVAGIGVGYLPGYLAEKEIARGRLVARTVVEAKPAIMLHLAWRAALSGKALKWFIQRLQTLAPQQLLQAPGDPLPLP